MNNMLRAAVTLCLALLIVSADSRTRAAVAARRQAADPASTKLLQENEAKTDQFRLRGYRGIRHESRTVDEPTGPVVIHRFVFDDATHTRWFLSKLYGDFALTHEHHVATVATAKGPADAVDLGTGLILPLLAANAREVMVVTGASAAAVGRQADRLVAAPPLRQCSL